MKTAHAVRKDEGITMSTALRLAWKSYRLKSQMKSEVVHFAFRKIDGTLREAVGTLVADLVPKYERKTDRPHTPSYTTQCYYDLDRGNFRCYRVASLLLN